MNESFEEAISRNPSRFSARIGKVSVLIRRSTSSLEKLKTAQRTPSDATRKASSRTQSQRIRGEGIFDALREAALTCVRVSAPGKEPHPGRLRRRESTGRAYVCRGSARSRRGCPRRAIRRSCRTTPHQDHQAMGFRREEVYIANVLNAVQTCRRGAGNRKPTAEEMRRACHGSKGKLRSSNRASWWP